MTWRRHGRIVFGVAPTAKAAHVLARDGDGDRHARQAPPRMDPAAIGSPTTATGFPIGTTVVVDEASMVGTSSLHQLIRLAEHLDWRLVLVGDPRQLQAVGRGGLFAELCRHQPHP